jgi:nucleotide-binding universal stress UspA family protein
MPYACFEVNVSSSFDVFLSHNSSDKAAVREIGTRLKARGLRVWLDEWELVPGRPWQEAMEQVITSVKAAAVLVGRDGIGPWEQREMRACLTELVERGLPVIPVLLPGVPGQPELPLLLRDLTWVDLRSGLTEQGLDRLVWGIRGSRSEAVVESDGDERSPAAPPADEQESKRQRRKQRLNFATLALGLVVGLLTIVTLVFDLPEKWLLFRSHVAAPTPVPAATPTPQPRLSLSAEILDGTSLTPLAGVRVWLPDYNLETVTDEMGVFRFELAVPKGTRVKLRASLKGYQDLDKDPMAGLPGMTYSMERKP